MIIKIEKEHGYWMIDGWEFVKQVDIAESLLEERYSRAYMSLSERANEMLFKLEYQTDKYIWIEDRIETNKETKTRTLHRRWADKDHCSWHPFDKE